MNFEDLDDVLHSAPDQQFGKGATRSEIEDAERQLGVKISGGYRHFLENYGWGGFGGLELYGLGADVPKYLDLITVTLSERNEMHPRLRTDLIPIWNDGGGNLYCLDTSFSATEPCVTFWDHEDGEAQAPVVIAPDFSTWLKNER